MCLRCVYCISQHLSSVILQQKIASLQRNTNGIKIYSVPISAILRDNNSKTSWTASFQTPLQRGGDTTSLDPTADYLDSPITDY